MKTFFVPVLFALVIASSGLEAQTTSRWDMFQTLDWATRLAFLKDQSVGSLDEDFLRKALDLTDTSRIETGTDSEITIKVAIAIRLVQMLAALPATSAAPSIARLPVQYRDPQLRGESWLALAKLGDKTAVPQLIRVLAGLNESSQRGRGEEMQATFAIQALGILKAPEAFRAVAAASLAWYTPVSGVRGLAKKTMALLVTDPEASIMELLANDDDLTLREGLYLSLAERGDPSLTARAGSALLSTLVRLIPRDKEDKDRVFRVTLMALTGAQKSPNPPASLVGSLKILVGKKANVQEVVQSIRLLGRIDDPSALAVLVETLNQYNTLQKSKSNTSQDLAYVKELFLALGQTGKAGARGPLDDARFSDYTPAMVRDATDALDKLPK